MLGRLLYLFAFRARDACWKYRKRLPYDVDQDHPAEYAEPVLVRPRPIRTVARTIHLISGFVDASRKGRRSSPHFFKF